MFIFRTGTVEITAINIGVERSRWTALALEKASSGFACEVMKRNRFDVLPIDDGGETLVTEYFHTQERSLWTSETIQRSEIINSDLLEASTSLESLVNAFVQSERTFYFLSQNDMICRLVTLADLNSRQAKFYLFAPLCELEVRLGRWVQSHVDEDRIRRKLKPDARGNYEIDRDRGFEARPIEYASLSNLLQIITQSRVYGDLGYTKQQFNELNTLVELRNQVMHPVRSLVHNRESLVKVKERLDKLAEVLKRLREI
ncbi:MAG TPA: hypothetical protein V6C65_39420 [Allocoleopsis sp.]